ncbi:MAG: endonuclease III [Methanobrevibacter woesei]|uniref:endonuclease III domain-containing protein n=1 Tax=Methanobrevibacter woesei TaxID=190976 RepID=UPI0023F1228C|nr:endonuclease III [Methanobrevibacter woesei]MCI7291345.1 endonuclease III [Methanobrevibacter woesei]
MSDYSKEEKSRLIVEKLNDVFDVRVFEDKDPYRVLVRTILSQRTRDENTDQATNNLFSKYKDIYEVADAPKDDIEELIRCSGFYRVKAGRIKEVSRILIDQYGGEVPDNMKELLELPGVGRKTANCVLVYAFEEPAIPVDTHVHRISNRLGLVNTKNPEDTEKELDKFVPEDIKILLNDLMVQFGQNICKPTSPQCEICPLVDLCERNI